MPPLSRRRVVITGIGAVSPLGNDREQTWRRVLSAESGAGPITQFDAETWPTTFACEVRNFKLPDGAMPAKLRRYLNRPSEFGAGAAFEAMRDSGIETSLDSDRFGISIGAGIGAISPKVLAGMLPEVSRQSDISLLSQELEGARDSQLVLQNHPGTLAALLSAHWNAWGPVTTIHTACASSGQSIGQAFLQIQRGEADVMLAGGADSLAGELLLAGFCLLGALSKRNHDPKGASRPFDKDRDGFVAGEGAAMLVLEEREQALKRGARIYAEVAGYGETESAYRITDLPPNGRGAVEAMRGAVADAGLDVSQIDYINAHGTSTELNDRVEALAIRRVFGSRGHYPFVSSTKAQVGHLISAAGALELAFCALSIRDGRVPPTLNLHETDCGDDLNLVGEDMIVRPVNATLSNSIGFGGSNSSIVLTRST